MQVSNDNNTKRRRTSSSPNDDSILSLSTLPGDHLTKVSSYLSTTCQALFACALKSLTNESNAILTAMGDTIDLLDFSEVGDSAGKLSDDDIGAVLVCIDAKNKLKKLLLTGCNNLVGHGLECLRQSTVLEHISFHLPMEGIIAILDSIVDIEGNSLCEIKVSNIKLARNDQTVRNFLVKINKLFLLLEGDKCDKCVLNKESNENNQVNTASRTCFECFRCCCEDCNDYADPEEEIRSCDHCGLSLCKKHRDREECDNCGVFHCATCADIITVGATRRCDGGPGGKFCYNNGNVFCVDCIDPSDCDACLGKHFPALNARFSEREEELNGEITRLRSNNGDLAEENEELRREIAELRGKMSSGLGILS